MGVPRFLKILVECFFVRQKYVQTPSTRNLLWWIGYAPKFRKMKAELEKLFPNQLEIEGTQTPDLSGLFEVEVNGVLLHSKKGGDGFVTDAKMARIVDGVRTALAAK